jgi:hypothetical protein
LPKNRAINLIIRQKLKGFSTKEFALDVTTIIVDFVIKFIGVNLNGGVKFLAAGSCGAKSANGLKPLNFQPIDVLTKKGAHRIGTI